MGRLPKFDRASISTAALELVSEGGPRAATISAIARRLGAPTGSIYHRFKSRDLLLAQLWMDVVEDFQSGFVAALGDGAKLEDALRAAAFIARWIRDHPHGARILLLHRREDFVQGAWPEALVRRAEALEPQLRTALRDHCRRRWGKTDPGTLQRLRFALLDVPYGALKPYVQSGRAPPGALDEWIEVTARAVLS